MLLFLFVITIPVSISLSFSISPLYVNPPKVKLIPSSLLSLYVDSLLRLLFISYNFLFFNSSISSFVHSPALYCTKLPIILYLFTTTSFVVVIVFPLYVPVILYLYIPFFVIACVNDGSIVQFSPSIVAIKLIYNLFPTEIDLSSTDVVAF